MSNIYVLPVQTRFPLGDLVVTTAAHRVIAPADVAKGLARHAQTDWGDVCDQDRAQNERALSEGSGLHSVYHDRNNVEFWIITEWDRSATTALLPDDY
jgi:hypothetical protein